MQAQFTRKLLQWHSESNIRKMPWKGEKDPYRVWLSEVILQQTRVEQGLAYYNKFINAFPTIHQLAEADDQTVFKMWEGLGYYSRCKNLIATARFISSSLHGVFPDTYQGIRALKGIGPYTAAAIASFAFNLPHAVVDGNVQRCLSRYFGILTPVDSGEGKATFSEMANALLGNEEPAVYNQAIMDFGAVICKPRLPACDTCIQRPGCFAFNNNMIAELPVKSKLLKKRTRWFYYIIVESEGHFFIRKRSGKDIWENLYEFVLLENESSLFLTDEPALHRAVSNLLPGSTPHITRVSKEYRQQLTHQTIIGQFITVSIQGISEPLPGYKKVTGNELKDYPFPRFITTFLNEVPFA